MISDATSAARAMDSMVSRTGVSMGHLLGARDCHVCGEIGRQPARLSNLHIKSAMHNCSTQHYDGAARLYLSGLLTISCQTGAIKERFIKCTPQVLQAA